MFITSNGNGWYIHLKDKDGLEAYLPITFKKGTEPTPQEVNEYSSIKGRMYFETDRGRREVFPAAYKRKNGEIGIKLVVMGYDEPRATGGDKVVINADELPFY